MDFPLDLSSRIEHRIDHELFYDDSDQLSLLGMSPHASMTQSISETTGLPSPSDTSERTTRAAPPAPPAPSAATEALDAQLLDTSASVSLPLPASHTSELASSTSDTPELSTDKSEDGQFLSQGTSDAGALVSRPPFEAVRIRALTSGPGPFVGLHHRVPIDLACAQSFARVRAKNEPSSLDLLFLGACGRPRRAPAIVPTHSLRPPTILGTGYNAPSSAGARSHVLRCCAYARILHVQLGSRASSIINTNHYTFVGLVRYIDACRYQP